MKTEFIHIPRFLLTASMALVASGTGSAAVLEYVGSSPGDWGLSNDLGISGSFMTPGPGPGATPAGTVYLLNPTAGGSFTQQIGGSGNDYQFFSTYHNDTRFAGEYTTGYEYLLSAHYTATDDGTNSPDQFPEVNHSWVMTSGGGQTLVGLFGVGISRDTLSGADYLLMNSFNPGSGGIVDSEVLATIAPATSIYDVNYQVLLSPVSTTQWQLTASGTLAGTPFSVSRLFDTPIALGSTTEMWARLDTGGDGDAFTNIEHLTWNATPIPEPASAGLVALGGLLVFRRKRLRN